jgi:hypothetical protein
MTLLNVECSLKCLENNFEPRKGSPICCTVCLFPGGQGNPEGNSGLDNNPGALFYGLEL